MVYCEANIFASAAKPINQATNIQLSSKTVSKTLILWLLRLSSSDSPTSGNNKGSPINFNSVLVNSLKTAFVVLLYPTYLL